jgi:hypothetical protein
VDYRTLENFDMNEFLANLIFVLHILFILFFTLVPFTNIKSFPELHILHLFTGPLLFVHWLANSSDCALTQMERFFRGDDFSDDKSFFFNLVNPIYKPTDDAVLKQIIWALSIGLWLITVTKFIKNPCVLRDFWNKVKYGPNYREEVILVEKTSVGVSF